MSDFVETLQNLQKQWRETGFCGKNGFRLYTAISFMLCLLLIVKFFGFDRTFRCEDDLCSFKMLIVLFSLAYSTLHLFALLFGHHLIQKVSYSSSRDATPLALTSAGIAFFIVLIMSIVLTIYSATTFDDCWGGAAFYCLCWLLQSIFTLLSVYMWKNGLEETIGQETSNSLEKVVNFDNETTVFSVEPRSDTNSEYTSLMIISPRLSTALIQQWIDRLCEVEIQNNPIEMRRTVREVLQHMNSMINC